MRLQEIDTIQDLASDAPQARYVTVVRDFVVSGYINSSTVYPNRVQWSALGDESSWANSATTQADFQDIPDGGSVVGLTGGEYGLVFMDRSIHRMSYIGSPSEWTRVTCSDNNLYIGKPVHRDTYSLITNNLLQSHVMLASCLRRIVERTGLKL